MRHSPYILFLVAASIGTRATAQRFLSPDELPCPEGTGPVRSVTLHSDSTCSSFVLCIDAGVKPHLHRTHTEHVFVLDGTAEMMLGDGTRAIKAGDVILIPPGTPHAVKVTSSSPLRVISIQSPHFDGTDRVWLDER